MFILLGQTLEESEILASGAKVEGLMAGERIRSLSLSPHISLGANIREDWAWGRGSLYFIACFITWKWKYNLL